MKSPTPLTLQFSKSENRASIRYPTYFYQADAVSECLENLHRVCRWDLTEQAGISELEVEAKAGELEKLIQDLFARLNAYPSFTDVNIDAFEPSQVPLLSCAILLTANDLFVANHLIPSIIQNSQGYDIEILIIYNGIGADLSRFKKFDVSHSEFGCVSKGYNQGAKRSRGKYLALFHDDCIVADPRWIDKCLNLLERGHIAVTPEIEENSRLGYQTPLLTAKNVPLVMRKDRFIELGGYDENYYIGYEDVDFTYQMLLNGRTFSKVDMRYFHFNGMSTILMFSGNSAYFKTLFAYHLVPKKTVLYLRNFYLHKLNNKKEIELLDDKQFLYFLSKFEWYWTEIGHHQALKFLKSLREQLKPNLDSPFLCDQQAMIELVQSQSQLAPDISDLSFA